MSKVRSIAEKLRLDIEDGKFDRTRRLPSEHELMRRFAVARETVRAAIRDLCARNLAEKRPGYGTFIVDRASALASQKFAVIVPDAWHPFYAGICRGIEDVARKNGWSVLQASLGTGGLRERAVKSAEFAAMFARERVSGVFFQPLQFMEDCEKCNRAVLAVFDSARIPVVLLDSDFLPPPQRSRYDLVGVDNTHIGYMLARHVIEQGAKKVVYFSNPMPAATSLKRAYGVGIAAKEAGLKWTRDNIIFANPADTAAAKRFFASKKRPDAIIAVNDLIAKMLLETLLAIGVKVPDDVMIAGVNGDVDSEEARVPITTVVQPCRKLGEAAVNMMLQRIREPGAPAHEVFISCEIVPRASTKMKVEKLKG